MLKIIKSTALAVLLYYFFLQYVFCRRSAYKLGKSPAT